MSSDAVIDIHGLSKRYEVYAQPRDRLRQMFLPKLRQLAGFESREYFKEFWALKNVNFSVARGETVAIIGQNGSGKSTLLQLICGTLSPTSGEAKIHGRIAALLELGAGFNPEFTGRENVFLSGLLYGISQKELESRYDAIVAFAEIGDFIDQPVKTYSSGMYVRLAFAIAAHVNADVLVVDEALSVGDVRFTQKCMRFLREFQKTGTLLFVSHDTSAVIGLCSRAVWLDRGVLRMDGPAKETVETYLAAQHAQDREVLGHGVELKVTPQHSTEPLSEEATLAVETAAAAHFKSARSEFGAGGAGIVSARLVNEAGVPIVMTYGEDLVRLEVTAEVYQPLDNLIFGFYLKDRLGQRLFGENTLAVKDASSIAVLPGERLSAIFKFRMPILPGGTYSLDLAIASGTQDSHTQQHWMHDALEVRAADTTITHGLIGLPMQSISVRKGTDD
ncbi:ABC transporter ATP-binding protein [Variovorax sp. HJSM1_2]|uniref:ABC transporter ATP-binding protein n=1 Tax=Variovorax sp. HJSM1_2 TaxID=3366263 RepID=UPI003BDC07D1